MSSRRKFLLNSVTLATAALATPLHAADGLFSFRRGEVSLEELSFGEFAAQVDTPFLVRTPCGRKIEMKLVKADQAPQFPQHGRRPAPDADFERFSLVFSHQHGEVLEQETYKFEHGRLGHFDLFIVPVFTRDPQATKYAAVFNRPRRNQTTG